MARKSVKPPETRENNKTRRDVVSERDMGYGLLVDHGGLRHKVEMWWDLGATDKADRIFKLKIDDKYAYLSYEEIERYLRWI